MTTPKGEHVGSGVDGPKPKSIAEKLSDAARKIVTPVRDGGNGTGQPQVPQQTPEDMTP